MAGPAVTRSGEHAGNGLSHANLKRAVLRGVEVRDDDIEPQKVLNVATAVLQACAAVMLLLAVWQVIDWWMHHPPGGAGAGVLAGETVRLIVLAGLLYAGSSLADVAMKTHHDLRASRILLARQTHIMQQIGVAEGAIPRAPSEGERRGVELGTERELRQ